MARYEGYNWLGAGVLLLVVVAVVQAAIGRLRSTGAVGRPTRIPLGLVVVLAALAVFSLSSRVYAGPLKLIDLGAKPWEDIFGTFRTPGRAFWPVGYGVMLLAVAAVARLPRAVGFPLLAVAVVLQIIDTAPLRASGLGAWERGAPIVTPTLPSAATMLTVAPFPGCTPDLAVKSEGPIMLLDAVRRGARTGDVGLGRSPAWFSCERILSDAQELPLLRGEVRAFFTDPVQSDLRTELLGPGAVCRRDRDAVVCDKDAGAVTGAPVASGKPLFHPEVPRTLQGADIGPLLGTGWHVTSDKEVWSEGPRSTLLFGVPPGANVTLTLRIAGIAVRPGGMRDVRATIGRGSAIPFSVADGQSADMVLHIPATENTDGLVRVALDVDRAIDPTNEA